jgi:restriction endonuclease Mrr
MDTIEVLLLIAIILICYLIYKLNQKSEEYTTLKKDYEKISNINNSQKEELSEYRQHYSSLEKISQKIIESEAQLSKLEQYKIELIKRIALYIEHKCDSYPHLAGLMSDMLTRHYEKSAKYLQEKKRPAVVEAKRIIELQKETKEIIKEKKICEYKLDYLRKLHPNIDDYFDSAFEPILDAELETVDTTDGVRRYLDHEEYKKLSTTQKNQLALDRYIQSSKTRWQIGRDYEMYIGYLCEKNGYKVEYTGISKRLEDMGRDLIVYDQLDTYVIQCKNWSHEKEIHENHIFQLYGSVVLYKIENPFFNVKAVFITTTKLSSLAEKIAYALDIEVKYIDMGEFPRIKCNIGRDANGILTKIYHLPFDQQYDKTQIIHDGECYATTVEEAEKLGFRRASRWLGDRN